MYLKFYLIDNIKAHANSRGATDFISVTWFAYAFILKIILNCISDDQENPAFSVSYPENFYEEDKFELNFKEITLDMGGKYTAKFLLGAERPETSAVFVAVSELNFVCLLFSVLIFILCFYPTALKGCQGIVFTHGVRMGMQASGRSSGQWEKVCPGCISETVRCRKLILGRDIG